MRFLLGIIISTLLAQGAQCLRLDNFSTEQFVFANGAGSVESDTRASAGSIGGFRSVEIGVQSGSGLFVIAQNGVLSHSQAAQVTGQTHITWDGNLNASWLNPVGLGNVDLTDDGGTALRVRIVSFDFAFSFPVYLVFTLYDAGDPSGLTFSSGTIPLTRSYTNENVELPFAQLTQIGPRGPARMTNVGAVSLRIDGQYPAIDLELSFVGTNGSCPSIPVNGKVLDACGVCGGDNSSCADCLGVPNGVQTPQTSCMTSSYGQCANGQWNGSCQCVTVTAPSDEVCDGIDNDCDGKVDEIVDQCGVCGGDGLSCLGCQGTTLEPLIAELDGNGRVQHSTVIKALRRLKRAARTDEIAAYAAETSRRSLELRDRTWRISWTVPSVHVTCEQETACVTVETSSTMVEYQQSAQEHRALLEEVVTRYDDYAGTSTPLTRLLRRKGDKQLRRAGRLAAKVPLSTLRCASGGALNS